MADVLQHLAGLRYHSSVCRDASALTLPAYAPDPDYGFNVEWPNYRAPQSEAAVRKN